MRPLALLTALVALLLAAAPAAAKPGHAEVRWLSTPDGGGVWEARLFIADRKGRGIADARPHITVTDATAPWRVRTFHLDGTGSPGTYHGRVEFAQAGHFVVAVAGYDPADEQRFTELGPPVRIAAAPAPAEEGETMWWPFAAAALAAALALQVVRSRRHPRVLDAPVLR